MATDCDTKGVIADGYVCSNCGAYVYYGTYHSCIIKGANDHTWASSSNQNNSVDRIAAALERIATALEWIAKR